MKNFTTILIIFLTINLCLFSSEIHNKSKSQVKSKIFSSNNQIVKNQIIKNQIIKKRIQQRLMKAQTQQRYGCEDGFVDDCSGDGDCCPESWIGDGFADCEDQPWGCDLTCYDNDGEDCYDDGGGDEGCLEDGELYCYGCELWFSDCEFYECTEDGWAGPYSNDECDDDGGNEDIVVSLAIGDATGVEGEIPGEGIQFGVAVPLFYESSEPIGGIQFTVSDNPDWVTGVELVSNTEDCFESNSNDVNGSIIGILFSLEGCELENTLDSAVHFATIMYEFSADAEWGELVDLVFSQAIVSDGTGNALSVETLGNTINVSVLGDVSSDMVVNVIDVVTLINYILFIEEPSDYQHWAADVNSDTTLNILDVVTLVGMILGD